MSEQKVIREKWGKSIAEDMLKQQHDLNVFLSGAIDAEVICKEMNMSDVPERDTDYFLDQIKQCACEPDKVYLYLNHARKAHAAAIKDLVEELRYLSDGLDEHGTGMLHPTADRLIKKYGGDT